ncbi:MAG: hypothetical protein IIT65_14000, partial [Lachnospiraceae bacterium]|nr:hypothetical protein [Lachnospiraceae bacterium]
MKTKRKRGKALLSVLLILSMLLSYAPPGGIVYAAPLTHADTVYDQKVFGFTYTENGATRNMYLYQSEDGKVKLTGDILFTTSSYGYYQVRHYDGYLELQNLEGLQIKQAILIQHGNLYTGDSEKANKHEAFFDLRILDENGDLWSFNAASNEMLTQLNFTNGWDPQVIPITKIEDIFYLDEYGNLGAISPESAIAHNYKIENEHYNTKIHKYWHIDEYLTNDVKDFLIVAPSTTPEEEFADPRYYRISENTQLYIQHTDDSQEIKAVKFVNDYLYDDYVCGYHYELSDSSLSVPVIDNGTNTLTVDGIAQGIDENWFYLQIDDENEVCLNSVDPTETTDTTKTYSVMDGHVTITLTKKTAESTTYNKFAVQSDSTDTIKFDSTTNTIITGYQDIKIYSISKPDAVIHEATKPIGYHESWSQSYGEESTTSTSIQNDSLTELLSMTGTKGYGEKDYNESSAGYAGQEAHHFSKKWINQNIVSYSITNERAANGTYYYDMDVQILGNHAVNNVGTTYPGFVFDTNDGHYAGTAGNYMIGDGLISCYKIKDFTFSTTKDGNCYNHVLDFNHNKHYIYKNHYKMAEYPMNFKDGETDTPYVYSEEEWQFAVYPKLDEDLNIWEAVVEFAYADNAPTTGADYPNINVKMSSTIALRKQLVNNGDDTYSRPNFTDEYNVFKSATIKSIQIGDTLIEGSSLGSLDAGNTPVYEMSGGKCVYRATNYKDNRITYDVMEDGSFYQGINGHSLVAKNVVKVDSSGNYLSDEGELFDFDGNKLH